MARKEIIREYKQIQSNNGFNNNNGTCGGSSEEPGQVLDQWGLVSRSGVRFGVCCIVWTNEKPRWSEHRAWSLVHYSFKNSKDQTNSESSSEIGVSQKKETEYRVWGWCFKNTMHCLYADFSYGATHGIYAYVAKHAAFVMQSYSAISLRRQQSVEVEAFLTWFSMCTISKWKQIDRYFQPVWPMPFNEVWKIRVPCILKSCWVAKSCLA